MTPHPSRANYHHRIRETDEIVSGDLSPADLERRDHVDDDSEIRSLDAEDCRDLLREWGAQ